MYIPYVLTGEWRLGRGLCKLWLVVDYMLCTASVFNIVLISFDRFQSVTKAVSVSQIHTHRPTLITSGHSSIYVFLLQKMSFMVENGSLDY